MTSDRIAFDRVRPLAPHPIRPIVDEPSYRAALVILDGLFALGSRKTRRHLARFRALARQARRFEIAQSRVAP